MNDGPDDRPASQAQSGIHAAIRRGAPTFQYGEYRAWEQACHREQHRTLTAPDAYAARGGWLSGRDAQTITYHAEYGEVSRVRVSADMLK